MHVYINNIDSIQLIYNDVDDNEVNDAGANDMNYDVAMMLILLHKRKKLCVSVLYPY